MGRHSSESCKMGPVSVRLGCVRHGLRTQSRVSPGTRGMPLHCSEYRQETDWYGQPRKCPQLSGVAARGLPRLSCVAGQSIPHLPFLPRLVSPLLIRYGADKTVLYCTVDFNAIASQSPVGAICICTSARKLPKTRGACKPALLMLSKLLRKVHRKGHTIDYISSRYK